MNILVPDSWLHEFLKTDAKPDDIRRCLSLAGPSVERVTKTGKDIVYDIEITSNRPDSMSVFGIAREAAAILPRSGFKATLVNDIYADRYKEEAKQYKKEGNKKLRITTDGELNPRFTAIVLDNVNVKKSPAEIIHKLKRAGIRPINTIVDITNYLMVAYGQPAHAFDFDRLHPHQNTVTLTLRASKKGENLTTLDGKTFTLPGGDIVIEDGSGTLVDLCGIMGGENSSITGSTKTVILFLQTYDPGRIRKTSMYLAHRTQAASLFEKDLDTESVLPVIIKGIDLVRKFSGAHAASRLYDIYPKPFRPYSVTVTRDKIDRYIGTKLRDADIIKVLGSLGLKATTEKDTITAEIPSYRKDIQIDVDLIEEIARIWGYHKIAPTLPASVPPMTIVDPNIPWEEETKVRLRDWGYTEIYGYSMISEELMDIFGFDKTKTYSIANPLTKELVYMRPSLLPTMLPAMKQNLALRDTLLLFELSMTYRFRAGDIPEEVPTLLVAWSGTQFSKAKGLAEALFDSMGIPFPSAIQSEIQAPDWYDREKTLALGEYGYVGLVRRSVLDKLSVRADITVLELKFSHMVSQAKRTKSYRPIPKFPPSYEDLAFVFPVSIPLGPVIDTLKKADPLVSNVILLDTHQSTRTFHVTYQSAKKNLTTEDIAPVRNKLIDAVTHAFGLTLKTL